MPQDRGERMGLGARGAETKWKEVNRLKKVKSIDLDNRLTVGTEGETVTKDVP